MTIAATTTQVPDSSSQALIERKLRKAWRKERRFIHTRGLCHLLLWLVALVLVDLVLDWWITSGKMPSWSRMALLGVNVLAVAWVVYAKWLSCLRRFNPVRVALQVERHHPELKSLLVSYVQFASPSVGEQMASQSLINALRRQAIAVTKPINFREIVSYKDLGRILGFSAAVLLVFAAMNIQANDFFATLIRRLVGQSDPYPTRTHIDSVVGRYRLPSDELSAPSTAPASAPAQASLPTITTGTAAFAVPQGAILTIEAECSGLVPSEGRFQVQPTDGSAWEKLTVPQSAARVFTHNFGQVFKSFRYHVQIGDAESTDYLVTVVPPPHLVAWRLDLQYPQHINPTPGNTDNLNPEVPEGTKVTWRLRWDRPLKSAEMLRLSGDRFVPEPMELDESGRNGSITVPAAASFPYRLRCVDREHGYLNTDPVEYFVQVTPDSPPTVEILSPRTGSKATRKYEPMIYFAAADDYGLARASLIFQVADKPEQRLPPEPVTGKSANQRVAFKLPQQAPDVEEGQTVTFWIEVADASGKQANVVRSAPAKVDIVSDTEFIRWITERLVTQTHNVEAMLTDEVSASQEIRSIRGAATQPDDSSPGSSGSSEPSSQGAN